MMLDHILDPQGEVIIVVRNPNAPFAVWPSTTDEGGESPKSSKEGNLNELLIGQAAEADSGTLPETTPDAFDHDLEEPESDVRIQASARHLMLGSPVFDKMLNGAWSEGKQFKEKGSIELVVDSWDVEALVIVLNIIHSHLLKVPRRVTVELLAKIAVIADYYNCESVQFFGGLWIRAIPKEPPLDYSRHMVLCLWASYFFNYRTLFTSYSSAAIEESTCHISSLNLPIPGNIIHDMNSKRISSMYAVISRVYKLRDTVLDSSPTDPIFCSSDCISILLGSLLRYMRPLGMRLLQPTKPYLGIRFSDVVNIANFKPAACARGLRGCDDTQECMRQHFIDMSLEFPESIGGLDLAEYATAT